MRNQYDGSVIGRFLTEFPLIPNRAPLCENPRLAGDAPPTPIGDKSPNYEVLSQAGRDSEGTPPTVCFL